MDFSDALQEAMKRAQWSATRVAYVAGASEQSVRKWLLGESTPRFESYQRLRLEMPGLADLVDGKAVA